MNRILFIVHLAVPVFFDLRNVYEPDEVEKHGIDYICVGLPEGEVELP